MHCMFCHLGPPAVLKPQDSLQVENPPYNADVEKDSGVTVTSGRALVTDGKCSYEYK